MKPNETAKWLCVYETFQKKKGDTAYSNRKKIDYPDKTTELATKGQYQNLCAAVLRKFKGGEVNNRFIIYTFL